ncbi:hypothetical protein PF011_g8333 [Phytophthora fragariae]|uniref:Crinkler effector protein N-terminal domain-containing protein n=1 Tax=Phytophthora fragariae TaxID=53985 RepID=A0A6A3L6S9_9STRA|nr:hypothetical protein PF011_g8333 [Phytophthora fragariae]
MARKWFQLVGERGSDVTSATAVFVDIEDVFAFRDAVKAKFEDSHLAGIAAADLTVFANRAAYNVKQALEEDSPIGSFGGSEKDALIVQVPTQQSFVWKEPKPLVESIGAKWDFQNSLDLGNLSYAIGQHYQAWRDGKTDKRTHPLFVCLDGPGTGKSRLLDEFPNVLKQQVGVQGDPAMDELLQNAYTFKVTFENGTTDNYGISGPCEMIGTRMLYQLQDSLAWMAFAGQRTFHLDPSQAMTKLSEITGTALRKMCVILCVDNLQKLQHEAGSKNSQFYSAYATLCDLVNASKCWVIAIFSVTISQPLDVFLMVSPQWTEKLQTTSLKRPTINGADVFGTFNNGKGPLMQLLVDDMGGHGRALEELFKVMKKHQGQAFEFIPVMHNVLFAVRNAYPAIIAHIHSMKQVSCGDFSSVC